jgi:hypothetical protein
MDYVDNLEGLEEDVANEGFSQEVKKSEQVEVSMPESSQPYIEQPGNRVTIQSQGSNTSVEEAAKRGTADFESERTRSKERNKSKEKVGFKPDEQEQWKDEFEKAEDKKRQANLLKLAALGLCGTDPKVLKVMVWMGWKEIWMEAQVEKNMTPEQRKFLEEERWQRLEEDDKADKPSLQKKATDLLSSLTSNTSGNQGTYDAPKHGNVYCRFTIFNIRDINIKTQSILTDFYFEAAWHMPSLLQEDGSLLTANDVDWETVWNPKIVFANKLGDLNTTYIGKGGFAVDPSYLTKFGMPMASYRVKISGEFSQLLDLHKFPYDQHNIEILIATDHLTSICKLDANLVVPSGAQVARFSIKDQWDLTFNPQTSVKPYGERKGAGGTYSQLTCHILAKRNPTYHLANTMPSGAGRSALA